MTDTPTGTAGAWRPVGFLVLMLGFGLRLGTAWQGVAWLLLVAGAVAMAAGEWRRSEIAAFVPRRSRR